MPVALPVLVGLLLLVPLLEILVFIKVGGIIGVLPTLAITVACAVGGAILVRRQGFDTLARIQSSLQRGVLPVREMTDGAVLLIAGVLLLTPGFLTDMLGLVLLLPAARRALVRLCLSHLPEGEDLEGENLAIIEAEYIDVSPGRRP